MKHGSRRNSSISNTGETILFSSLMVRTGPIRVHLVFVALFSEQIIIDIIGNNVYVEEK